MGKYDLKDANIAVIGAGTMGIGIAQLAAMHGHSTLLFDVDMTKSIHALEQLKQQMNKRVQAGKMTPEMFEKIFNHLSVAQHIEQLSDTDLIIEAIVENKEIKQTLFKQLADVCSPDTILASNTSSISITAIAAVIPQPERVVGLHFFNPAPVMKLVEIIRGLKTSSQIADALWALMNSWNKVPVIAKSTPGFIVNRVARPYYAEAFRALQENTTTPEQLDFIMRECGGFAMGPCELTDLIGQDINFSVTKSVYQAFFDEPRYRPSLIQQELVDAGCLGRKSGHGFYDYSQSQHAAKYELPSRKLKLAQGSQVTVRGAWQHSSDLIQKLVKSEDLVVHFEQSDRDEISLDGITLRLCLGESVDLNYADQKVVLMDWHKNWDQAQAVALSASNACDTDDIHKIDQLFNTLNMIPIWMKDHPGMLVLRTISMLVNESCEAVLHDVCSEQDIDLAMKYGVNYPCGPFEWAEKIGYNNILQILENMYHIYAEERYRPSIYLRKKVALGTTHPQERHYRQAG